MASGEPPVAVARTSPSTHTSCGGGKPHAAKGLDDVAAVITGIIINACQDVVVVVVISVAAVENELHLQKNVKCATEDEIHCV